jgi:D-aspartate ligase
MPTIEKCAPPEVWLRPGAVPPAPHAIGAVVIGGDYQGLGIVRSLGRRGVPVCVVDDEYSISRYSRYCDSFVRVAELHDHRQSVNGLLEIGKRLGMNGWVLYPTREELVAAFSHHRSELSEVFRVPTADWESVKWAWDKRNTYRLAKQLDIPTPATYYPENIAQLADLNEVPPPFVIKPAIKEHFFYAAKAKAWRANSHSELRDLFPKASKMAGSGEIMVQELIPGGGSQQFSYCAFFRNEEPVGKMVARRVRQHPPLFGKASTYVETVDLPALEELSERFLRAIGYYGLVEMEYKLDPRDSRYKLLDVNARTWGYHSVGAHAGVDFSYMLYCDQVGLPVAARKGQPGSAWVRTTTDIPAAMAVIFSGETGWRSYFRSLAKCNVEAVFSASDPLPGVAELALLPYMAMKRGF